MCARDHLGRNRFAADAFAEEPLTPHLKPGVRQLPRSERGSEPQPSALRIATDNPVRQWRNLPGARGAAGAAICGRMRSSTGPVLYARSRRGAERGHRSKWSGLTDEANTVAARGRRHVIDTGSRRVGLPFPASEDQSSVAATSLAQAVSAHRPNAGPRRSWPRRRSGPRGRSA